MPPVTSVLRAARPATPFLIQQTKQISSSAAHKDLRKDVPGSSPAQSALNIDADSSTSAVRKIFNSYTNRNNNGQQERGEGVEDRLAGKAVSEDYMRQLPRRWREGELYAPHDLSPQEMAKFRRATPAKRDLVDLLGLQPLDMYRNFSFISEYMSPHGRVLRSDLTGLRPVNQRKVAKAIRRAIGLGIHPSVHRHPELLARSSISGRQQTASERPGSQTTSSGI